MAQAADLKSAGAMTSNLGVRLPSPAPENKTFLMFHQELWFNRKAAIRREVVDCNSSETLVQIQFESPFRCSNFSSFNGSDSHHFVRSNRKTIG